MTKVGCRIKDETQPIAANFAQERASGRFVLSFRFIPFLRAIPWFIGSSRNLHTFFSRVFQPYSARFTHSFASLLSSHFPLSPVRIWQFDWHPPAMPAANPITCLFIDASAFHSAASIPLSALPVGGPSAGSHSSRGVGQFHRWQDRSRVPRLLQKGAQLRQAIHWWVFGQFPSLKSRMTKSSEIFDHFFLHAQWIENRNNMLKRSTYQAR